MIGIGEGVFNFKEGSYFVHYVKFMLFGKQIQTHARQQIQNLTIASWTTTKEEQLTKVNLSTKENVQHVKVNFALESVVT
jgi:extradiol dioxygenase family protein